MDKIIIHKQNGKPVGKNGGCIWVSKEVNDTLDAICDETGIAKQRMADFLLKKALEAVHIETDEL